MGLARIERSRVRGALAGLAENRSSTWCDREGLRLALFDEDGRVGLGEASPLPGYSPDTLDAAEAALTLDPAALFRALTPIGDSLEGVVAAVGRVVERFVGPVPSARCALETAIFDLVGQRLGVPVHVLFGRTAPPAVPVSSLLFARSPRTIAEEAHDRVTAGAHTLKVKLGRAGLADELALLGAVRASVPRSVHLRLDANGQTTITPRVLLDAVAPFDVELVEEPGPFDAIAALDQSPVPIALDESLQSPDAARRLDALASRGLVTCAVLKMMALGGVSVCLSLAEIARARGASVVVTHLFDGPIAHAAATHLALAIESDGVAAGLDAHAGLDPWPELASASGRRTLPWLEPGHVVSPGAPGLFSDDVRRVLLGGPR